MPPSIQIEGFSANIGDFYKKVLNEVIAKQFEAETIVSLANGLRYSYLKHLKSGHGHDNADVGSEYLFTGSHRQGFFAEYSK